MKRIEKQLTCFCTFLLDVYLQSYVPFSKVVTEVSEQDMSKGI